MTTTSPEVRPSPGRTRFRAFHRYIDRQIARSRIRNQLFVDHDYRVKQAPATVNTVPEQRSTDNETNSPAS